MSPGCLPRASCCCRPLYRGNGRSRLRSGSPASASSPRQTIPTCFHRPLRPRLGRGLDAGPSRTRHRRRDLPQPSWTRGPGVRLLGYPRPLADFYDEADLVVGAEADGLGLKMKVGEALSYGRPVIGTEIGLGRLRAGPSRPSLPRRRGCQGGVLAVVEDRRALEELTAASERLFARYAAVAEEAEAELIGCCVRTKRADRPPRPARGERVATTGRRSPLRALRGEEMRTARPPRPKTCRRRRRPHDHRRALRPIPPRHRPRLGILVATERRPGEGSAASYAPERRRWFARSPTRRAGAQARRPSTSRSLPEWVRNRALPPCGAHGLGPGICRHGGGLGGGGPHRRRAGDRIEIATICYPVAVSLDRASRHAPSLPDRRMPRPNGGA